MAFLEEAVIGQVSSSREHVLTQPSGAGRQEAGFTTMENKRIVDMTIIDFIIFSIKNFIEKKKEIQKKKSRNLNRIMFKGKIVENMLSVDPYSSILWDAEL